MTTSNRLSIEDNQAEDLSIILKATLNILEDFAAERKMLEDFRRATINILEDFNDEKNNVKKINEKLHNEINEHRKTEEQLKLVNKELEGFSYSVSHDLRAPLRAIQGYSRILFEMYGYMLDDNGRELLKDIIRNSENMGQLIDDILHFSRMSRKETHFTLVDMTSLFTKTFNEIFSKNNNPNLTCKIHRMPNTYADPVLIKQVIINLLSNAIKYSSTRNNPYIEVNGQMDEERNVYWISDNGVGFDMKYKDKLFGVFQRLHRADQFEGTGVGLAIVHRIIEKHGGSIWAESSINNGATFYFSIPIKRKFQNSKGP